MHLQRGQGARVRIGDDLLDDVLKRGVALDYVRDHHEHWDGGGYPHGLRGERIPLAGRICAICDVFDALLSARPYKDAWPLERSIAEIERLSGTQFNPGLVHAFIPIARELHREWFPADAATPSEAPALSAI